MPSIMTEAQPGNLAMYKDFLMQFAQQQNPLTGLPRTPPNPASLLAAAAGNQNLLQNNPALLHQMQQHLQREVANRRNQFPNAEKLEKNSERESPMSTGQSSSTSRDLLNALSESQKLPNLMKPDQAKTPRRNDQKEQHKCPKCDYTTPWKSSIATHMKLKHSNERPWRCDICGKAYKLKHHLKAHMEGSHASEKPYQCKLCVFSCIDSRTLNKHMFNKHGRQTPIKSGSNLLGRGGARGLPTMLPMLGGRPYADFNPLWARKPAAHSGLDQVRIENELRNRFPALPSIPNLEQLQLLQDQAALMANITKNNELLQGERQEMMMPGNSMMQNPNSVLIAQIAAQMQRACQHQMNNSEMQRHDLATVEEVKDIVNIKSEENSRTASPKIETNDGQISVLSDGEGNAGDDQPLQLTNAPFNEDNVDEGDKKSVKSAQGDETVEVPSGENNDLDHDKTSSMETTREEEIKDQNESIEISQAKNDDSHTDGTHTDIVVEPTSPMPSFGGSVKSEKVHELNEDLLTNSRKRKLDEPLDYSINEQLFQHRLQQNRQLFPFPMPNFPNRERRLSGGSSDEMSPPANRIHNGMNAMASMAFQRMQNGGNGDILAQLSQLQHGLMTIQRCEHCQITFPDPMLYIAHAEMHKKSSIHAFQCARCNHRCKDRTEFFLHFRNNEHDI